MNRKVYLARKRKTGDLYAVKMLKKDDMVRKNMVDRVMTERNIMAGNNNSFVVKLYYAFQSEVRLALTLPCGCCGSSSSPSLNTISLEIPVSRDGVHERRRPGVPSSEPGLL